MNVWTFKVYASQTGELLAMRDILAESYMAAGELADDWLHDESLDYCDWGISAMPSAEDVDVRDYPEAIRALHGVTSYCGLQGRG